MTNISDDKYKNMAEYIVNCSEKVMQCSTAAEQGDALLKPLLELTDSEFGYVNEIRVTETGKIYLHCIMISDISWDEASRKYHMENKPTGFNFYNCDETTMYGIAYLHNLSNPIFICDDVQNDSRRGGKPIYPGGHPHIKSFLAFGLYWNGELIGQCAVANNPGGYTREMAEALSPFNIESQNLHFILIDY